MKLVHALLASAVLFAGASTFVAPVQAGPFVILMQASPVGNSQPVQEFRTPERTAPDYCDNSGFMGCDLDLFIEQCIENGGGPYQKPGGGVECDTSGWE